MTNIDSQHRKLTTHQIATMLGVSDQSVANWVDARHLPASRTPGGHRRIKVGDLVVFLRQQGVSVPQELQPASMTILVVDDEQEVAESVASLLRHHCPEYQVVTATDGFAAGRLVSDLLPDLVLLDLYMPGLDGFEVCRRVKSDPKTADIKVVAMTAHHTDEAEQAIIEAGAEFCFAKPLVGDALAGIVCELLVCGS